MNKQLVITGMIAHEKNAVMFDKLKENNTEVLRSIFKNENVSSNFDGIGLNPENIYYHVWCDDTVVGYFALFHDAIAAITFISEAWIDDEFEEPDYYKQIINFIKIMMRNEGKTDILSLTTKPIEKFDAILTELNFITLSKTSLLKI